MNVHNALELSCRYKWLTLEVVYIFFNFSINTLSIHVKIERLYIKEARKLCLGNLY